MQIATNQIRTPRLDHTVVRAIVHKAEFVGFTEDGEGTMDSNPERTDFTVIVIAGSEETFREWFLEVADSGIIAYGHTMQFTEIGSSPWKIEDGALIEISFPQFLEARLNWLQACAKSNVNMMAVQAIGHIQHS